MPGIAALVVLAVLIWLTPASAQPPGSSRHSGTLVEIGLDLTTIVVEEVVAWRGLGTGVVRRSLRLSPHTAIELLERPGAGRHDPAARLGWLARALAAAGLREGDFVTVTMEGDRRDMVIALQVVRPGAD
jgi:hypothetical protein